MRRAARSIIIYSAHAKASNNISRVTRAFVARRGSTIIICKSKENQLMSLLFFDVSAKVLEILYGEYIGALEMVCDFSLFKNKREVRKTRKMYFA